MVIQQINSKSGTYYTILFLREIYVEILHNKILISFLKEAIWFFHHIVLLSKVRWLKKRDKSSYLSSLPTCSDAQSQVWGVSRGRFGVDSFVEKVQNGTPFLPQSGRPSPGWMMTHISWSPGHFEVWTLWHTVWWILSSGRWISKVHGTESFASWLDPALINHWLLTLQQEWPHTAESLTGSCPEGAPRLVGDR